MKWILVHGSLLGAGFGLWNLIATRLNPLAEDDPSALLIFYGPMFTIWGFAGFVAFRSSGRLSDAVKVGAALAFVTFAVFNLADTFITLGAGLVILEELLNWRRERAAQPLTSP